MAFVRYKGVYAYLVANERVREHGCSRVRQKVLCYLGREPEVTDALIAEVERRYPGMEIDWGAIAAGLTGAPVIDEDEEWVAWD